ncbi:MAG: (2Fe-2S)-binding protein [Minwuia sp.]|nr:(2Fe-2S)-binding protein [Minwuia sp.]
MSDLIGLRFRLNGIERVAAVAPSMMLAELLREQLGQIDVRVSCDQGVCGVCTVLVEGTPTTSCLTPAFLVANRDVVTVKGLSGDATGLTDVQRAFIECSAFQCGYCTPGMVLSATALLAEHPAPDRQTIRDWLDANVCRCTGYQVIIEAIELAASRRQEQATTRIAEAAD